MTETSPYWFFCQSLEESCWIKKFMLKSSYVISCCRKTKSSPDSCWCGGPVVTGSIKKVLVWCTKILYLRGWLSLYFVLLQIFNRLKTSNALYHQFLYCNNSHSFTTGHTSGGYFLSPALKPTMRQHIELVYVQSNEKRWNGLLSSILHFTTSNNRLHWYQSKWNAL